MSSPRTWSADLCGAAALLAMAACSTTVAGDQAAVPDAGGSSFPDAAPQQAADAAPQVQPCVEGNTQATDPDDDTCYMLFNTLSSWQAAQAACLAVGANLAIVEDQAEQSLVAGLSGNFPAGAPDLWLGATDEALENSFVWVDGAPMIFQNWRSGEPNNSGPNGSPENCAVIEGDTAEHGWDDRSCTVPAPYICERSAP